MTAACLLFAITLCVLPQEKSEGNSQMFQDLGDSWNDAKPGSFTKTKVSVVVGNTTISGIETLTLKEVVGNSQVFTLTTEKDGDGEIDSHEFRTPRRVSVTTWKLLGDRQLLKTSGGAAFDCETRESSVSKEVSTKVWLSVKDDTPYRIVQQERRETRAGQESLYTESAVKVETLSMANREIKCLLLDFKEQREGKTTSDGKVWRSSDVPGSIVRSEGRLQVGKAPTSFARELVEYKKIPDSQK